MVVWAVFKGRRANLPTPPLLALGAGFLAAGLSVPRVRLGCLAFPLVRGGGPLSLSVSVLSYGLASELAGSTVLPLDCLSAACSCFGAALLCLGCLFHVLVMLFDG